MICNYFKGYRSAYLSEKNSTEVLFYFSRLHADDRCRINQLTVLLHYDMKMDSQILVIDVFACQAKDIILIDNLIFFYRYLG